MTTARERYEAAAHAIQSGVSFDPDPRQRESKHLRVGINMRAVDHAALAALMIRKGIITEEEYFEELANQAEAELALYEAYLTEKLGAPIKLR